MYKHVSLEQALSLEKIRKFATELGMHGAENKNVEECSKYVLDCVSKSSQYTLHEFIAEFFKNVDYNQSVLGFERAEEIEFNKNFVYPLVLGKSNNNEDEGFPIYGSVFKSKDGRLYTLHTNLNFDKYAVEYYFNNKYVGYIKWGHGEYTVPRKLVGIMCNMFQDCVMKKIVEIIHLEEDEYDEYFVPFQQ